MNRISRQEMFTEMVKTISSRSVCNRLQVGALIERKGRVVSIGYNGPVSGKSHCCSGSESECTEAIHAEMNAIAWAAREGIKVFGSSMYVTHSPCINCAKVIINSGIQEVFYLVEYRNTDGIDYLRRNGVDCSELRS